jgi:site-specific DNA recombinase
MVVLDEWERAGVQVVFVDRPPSRDPHEQLVTQIRGAVAEYERTLIADRMRRGRLAKLRAGQLLPWTSHVPYGYSVDAERPRDPALVTVEPYEASVVQEVFAAYADGGATLHGLAETLTRRGVPTPTGLRLWSPATLHGILTNPAYVGQAVAQRHRTRAPQQRHSPLRPIGRTRERHSSPSRPREERIVVPVPAVVPEARFVAAQRRLVHNRTQRPRSYRQATGGPDRFSDFLLTSMTRGGPSVSAGAPVRRLPRARRPAARSNSSTHLAAAFSIALSPVIGSGTRGSRGRAASAC